MSKKTKFILCAIAATVSIGICIVTGTALTTLWAVSTWGLLFAVIGYEHTVVKLREKIKEQEEYIKEADEHIHYLTNHDTWKQIRMSEAKAQNCYHYLLRISQLKAQNEQLRILNRNLLHNQGKGVRNYAKHTNRRADKRRTASDFE